jgi:hypothetical protein
MALVAMFAEDFAGRILPFDSASVDAYVEIVSERREMGRPISQFDAQIAAIARRAGARLATRNTDDFRNCKVSLIDPWTGWSREPPAACFECSAAARRTPRDMPLMAKAPPERLSFRLVDRDDKPEHSLCTHPNDNGPSPCDEGPLEGLCPVLPGVADGTRNGDLSR